MKKIKIRDYMIAVFLLGIFSFAYLAYSGNILIPKVITLEQFKEEVVQASPEGVKPGQSAKSVKKYIPKLVVVEFWADVEYCNKIAATLADMMDKYKAKVKFVRVVVALKGEPDFGKKLWENLDVSARGIKTYSDLSRRYCQQGGLLAVPTIFLVTPNTGGSKGEVKGCMINADEIIQHLDEAIKTTLAE